MNLLHLNPTDKRIGFKNFLLKRNPSESFVSKYMQYLNSTVVRNKTNTIIGCDNIYKVESLSKLNQIYLLVKADEANVRLHNVYSGVVSAYIKYITGNELRKRVNNTKEKG